MDTKLCFDTGNCCDINYLKPTRKGFEFLGWYDAPENGNIVYDSNGKCINNGNYWKDSSYVNPNNLTVYAQWKKVSYSAGTILNVEGSDYIVMSQTDDDTYLVIDGESLGNIQHQPNVDSYGNYKVGTYETPDEKRPEGQYSNTYAGIYIDNYLENTWYKQLPEKLQKAIQATDIKQSHTILLHPIQNGDGLIQMEVQAMIGIIMKVLQKIQNGSSIIRQTFQRMHRGHIL